MMNGLLLRRRWRWVLGTTAAAVTVITAGMAWACVAVMSLTANPGSVPPGGTVAVTGRNTAPGAVIEIHLDSPTGRLLATVPPHNQSIMQSLWTLQVPIPPDVSPGRHLLVATQDYHNHNAGVPARATIYVGQPAEGAAPPPARPTTLEVGSGPSAATLLMTALGVASVALLLAGLWYLVASRRPSQPEAQPARVS